MIASMASLISYRFYIKEVNSKKGKYIFPEDFDKMRGKRRRYGCCYSPKIGVTYKDNWSTMPVLCRKGEADSWDATDALRRHTIDL